MITIQINKEIFSENTIMQAIYDYKTYAKIIAKNKKKIVELTFFKCKYDEKITVKEFQNYMIGLENR